MDDLALTLPAPRQSVATSGLDEQERRVYAFLKNAQKTNGSKKRVALLEQSVAAAKSRRKTG